MVHLSDTLFVRDQSVHVKQIKCCYVPDSAVIVIVGMSMASKLLN